MVPGHRDDLEGVTSGLLKGNLGGVTIYVRETQDCVSMEEG